MEEEQQQRRQSKRDKYNKRDKYKYPEMTGDFWKDRERVSDYYKNRGFERDQLRQSIALWENDAVRRCDRLYYQ